MKRPDIENLKAKMRGEALNAYQKGLALNDYEMLLKYMNHLEQENQRLNEYIKTVKMLKRIGEKLNQANERSQR